MLAKEFPSWAPEKTVKRWRNMNAEANGTKDAHTKAAADMFHRLLTEASMEKIWKKIKKDDQAGVKEGAFISAVWRGFLGLQREQKFTQAKRKDWLNEVRKNARALAALIKHTTLDQHLQRADLDSIFILSRGQSQLPMRAFSSFAAFLENFAEHAPADLLPAVLGKTGTHNWARRNFFIYTIAEVFVDYFDGPFYTMVTTITNIAFTNCVELSPLERKNIETIYGRIITRQAKKKETS